jgi:hypothetical protein
VTLAERLTIAAAIFSILILMTALFAPHLPNLISVSASSDDAAILPEPDMSVYEIAPQSLENAVTRSMTIPDTPIGATVKITPDVKYTPTPQDIEMAREMGFALYNFKFEINDDLIVGTVDDNLLQQGAPLVRVSYFLPYTAMTDELLASLEAEGLINPTTTETAAASATTTTPNPVSNGQEPPQTPNNPETDPRLVPWYQRPPEGYNPYEPFISKETEGLLVEFGTNTLQEMAGTLGSIVQVLGYGSQWREAIGKIQEAQNCLDNPKTDPPPTPEENQLFQQTIEDVKKGVATHLTALGALIATTTAATGKIVAGGGLAAGAPGFLIAVFIGGSVSVVLQTLMVREVDKALKEEFARLEPIIALCTPDGEAAICKAAFTELPSITQVSMNAMPPLPSPPPPPPSSSNCLPTTTQSQQQPPSQQPPEIITPTIPPVTDQPPIVESPPPSPPSPIQSVNATNNPPSAFDDTVTTMIDMPIAIKLTASDPDRGDKLTASVTLTPSNGMLGNIDQRTHTVTYSPNPGFTGTDSFMFKVNDGKADSNTALVTIAILTQDEWLATTESTTPSTTIPDTNSQPVSDNENNSPADDVTSSSTTITTTTTDSNAADQDGDGFTSVERDCDDSNPNAFPAAIELAANSVDDDCNGTVDDIDSSGSTTTTTAVLPTSEENATISTSTEFAQLVEEGINLLNHERYDEAIEYFDRALEIDPTDSTTLSNKETVLVNKASDLADLGRYDEAMEVIDEALSILPNDDVALTNKGVYLSQLERYDEAIEYFDRALAINPGNTEASDSRDAVIDVRDNGGTLEMSTTNTTEESDTDTSENAISSSPPQSPISASSASNATNATNLTTGGAEDLGGLLEGVFGGGG